MMDSVAARVVAAALVLSLTVGCIASGPGSPSPTDRADATASPRQTPTASPWQSAPATSPRITPHPVATGSPRAGHGVVPFDRWVLLWDGVARAEAGTIAVSTSERDFERRWVDARVPIAPPVVDFADAIVIFFHPIVPGDCLELSLLGLGLDHDERLVYGIYQQPAPARDCSDVAMNHTFILAVERSALPRGTVTVRNALEYQVCRDCGRELEETQVDL